MPLCSAQGVANVCLYQSLELKIMAFRTNTSAAAAMSNTLNQENWKADGFVNLYLPSTDGGKRKKLGAIPLRSSKPSEAALLEWLKKDANNVNKLLSKLELDFQSVEASAAIGFALD